MGTLWGQNVVQVGKTAAMEAVVSKVAPAYPVLAKQLRLEGTVEINVMVSEVGEVTGATIASGNPILGKAAIEALNKWKFKPFKDPDGKPAQARATVALAFKL